ncbi:acyl-CoA thioester hydrolase [Natronospira proteinivora]|uniref:Acyl-CoA thioester hydrolase n=1 Tax=Natronospira proteinivora TaxID=1807133 RepID=A0ABT1G430_9GAMM|nr:acyl-CoA thioesterase [Natronospira proteinivora]MCP1726054.1 acyl-CoA thioester hydrolase [Natronospira proteinivora]
MYEKEYEIRWVDLDPNGHMRHSAYLDYGAQIRLSAMAEYGLSMVEMAKQGVGPVLFKEAIEYRREIRGGETIRVATELSGLSVNGKHWRMRHLIKKADGELAAVIEVQGAWLDLKARRVAPAPETIQAMVGRMPRSEDFEEFDSSKR